jgi:circadian clock protein KaiC
VEIKGELRKIVMVLKMRGGAHSKEIREYDITSDGIVIGGRIRNYDHLITGLPTRTRRNREK